MLAFAQYLCLPPAIFKENGCAIIDPTVDGPTGHMYMRHGIGCYEPGAKGAGIGSGGNEGYHASGGDGRTYCCITNIFHSKPHFPALFSSVQP